MNFEERERYLPVGGGLREVFNEVRLRYAPYIGSSISENNRAPFPLVFAATGEHIMAGMSYLANRTEDPQLITLGQVGCNALMMGMATLIVTGHRESDKIPLPPELRALVNTKNSSAVKVIYVPVFDRYILEDMLIVAVPTQFLDSCQNQPLLALSSIVLVSSHLRDYVNCRQQIDMDYIFPRANAAQAHFLRHAFVHETDVAFRVNDELKKIMSMYPEGLSSLPPAMRYASPLSGMEPLNAANN